MIHFLHAYCCRTITPHQTRRKIWITSPSKPSSLVIILRPTISSPKMSTTAVTETTTTTGIPVHSLLDPPPYTPPVHNFLRADEDDEEESQSTTNFVIHAPTTVHGSGNIIAIPPPDVPRLTAAVIATVSQKMRLPRNFSVQINCGVNIIGDRNIVGSPAIRPLAANQQRPAASVAAQSSDGSGVPGWGGRSVAISMHNVGKRKASEVGLLTDFKRRESLIGGQDPEDSPNVKKAAVDATAAAARPDDPPSS